uniref:Inhibitor of growth protein n=1 Tax=Astyanax mexicanus TaxID=7994 RepID=A0A8B9L5L3_ASTMX
MEDYKFIYCYCSVFYCFLYSNPLGIEGLPFELQRNFSLMTDLDNRTELKKVEIDNLAAEYTAKVKNLSSEERMEHLKRIENAYDQCREFSDDKVLLAMQIYEMVDKHIRRLDADLARFESELKDKLDSSGLESSDEKKSRKDKNVREKKRCSGRGQKTSNNNSPKHTAQKTSPALLAVQPSDVLDMPVDPNEPTYCLCSQVSYGEMIGCDNADCPIEWFHFACVDLTTKPKGEWFCPRCVLDMRKK